MDGPRVIAGRYTLDRPLGAGAQGMVWLARDETLQREVAIKQVANNHRQMGEAAEVARQRAMREGRIAARLSHPHAVAVYDVAVDDDGLWLVMEYVRCRTLTEIVHGQGTVAPQRAALIGFQIASALAEAHRIGVVHRDVKPSNILIAETGEAKITDFGIARSHGDATLTATGLVTGTPAYFAPELARGAAEPNPSTDVWSLGATLYYAVEGRPPYGSDENPLVLLGRIARQEVPRPRSAGTLTSALMRLLDRVPARRPSMAEARAVLSALSRGTATIPLAALEEETAEHDRVPRRTAVQPAVGRAQPPRAPSLLPWERPAARQAGASRPDPVSDETMRYDPVGASGPEVGAPGGARGPVDDAAPAGARAGGRVDDASGTSHDGAGEPGDDGLDRLSEQTTDELPAGPPENRDAAEEQPAKEQADDRSGQSWDQPEERPDQPKERPERSGRPPSERSEEAVPESEQARSEQARSEQARSTSGEERPGPGDTPVRRSGEEPGSAEQPESRDRAFASRTPGTGSSRSDRANGQADGPDSATPGTPTDGAEGVGAAGLAAATAAVGGVGARAGGSGAAGSGAAGSGVVDAGAGVREGSGAEAGEQPEKVPAAAVVGRQGGEAATSSGGSVDGTGGPSAETLGGSSGSASGGTADGSAGDAGTGGDEDADLRGAPMTADGTVGGEADAEPSAVETKPSATDSEPSAADSEPSAADSEPSAADVDPEPRRAEFDADPEAAAFGLDARPEAYEPAMGVPAAEASPRASSVAADPGDLASGTPASEAPASETSDSYAEPEPVGALAYGSAGGQGSGDVPPPESATGSPSPPAVPGRARVRRRTVLLVACAILVLLAGFGVYLLDQAGDDGREQLTADTPTEEKGSEGRRPGKEEQEKQEQEKQERRQEPTNEPRNNDPSPENEEDPDTEDTTEEEPPLMRAEVMTQTVQEYYAMLPDNHAEAWNWLGPELQSQGFDDYAGWWSSVASVEVRNLQADPSGKTVTGTVVFRMKSGRVASERHRFGMIESEDGSRLLINTDSYLS